MKMVNTKGGNQGNLCKAYFVEIEYYREKILLHRLNYKSWPLVAEGVRDQNLVKETKEKHELQCRSDNKEACNKCE